MNTKRFTKTSLMLVTSLLAAAAMLAAAAAPAFALDHIGPFSNPSVSSTATDEQLQAMFKHDKDWFAAQTAELRSTGKQTKDFTRMSNNEAKQLRVLTQDDNFGYNLRISQSIINKNLAAFDQNLMFAENIHADAAAVLAAPLGFSSDGTVINATQAITTLRVLGGYLSNAQYYIARASYDLNHARPR